VPEVNVLDDVQADYDFMATWTLVTRPRELIAPDGKPAQLSRAEARLLLALAENAGSVLDREALTRRVVQRSWHPTDRYIDVLVAHLRKKFGERGSDARVIRTVPNDGYVFTLRVVDERRAGPKSCRDTRRGDANGHSPMVSDVPTILSAPQ
jgi:DNA-binding response OmpR family regulator